MTDFPFAASDCSISEVKRLFFVNFAVRLWVDIYDKADKHGKYVDQLDGSF